MDPDPGGPNNMRILRIQIQIPNTGRQFTKFPTLVESLPDFQHW